MAQSRQVRKCLLRKWANFQGYGFNLHAEKGKHGQYVGQIDKGSPAVSAGLKEGDRIVEVDGHNIGTDSHAEVVGRVRSCGDSVWLLVVDKDTDEYCKNNDINVSEDCGVELEVIVCSAVDPNLPVETEEPKEPANEASSAIENDYEAADVSQAEAEAIADSVADAAADSVADVKITADDSAVENSTADDSAADDSVNSAQPAPSASEPVSTELPSDDVKAEEPKPTEPEKPAETPAPAKQEEQNGTSAAAPIESMAKMSAAQMKEALRNKKKADPRTQKLSAKQKLDMFQRL